MTRFIARYAGQAFWLGKTKIKFRKGIYQTDNPEIIAFLKKQRECTIVPGTEPTPAPVQQAEHPSAHPEHIAPAASSAKESRAKKGE
jgi:hypothetical protein